MIPRIGIELEYMIVDRDSLDVRPIADQLLAAQNGGEISGEVEVGGYCWSNELVLHVVELKTNGPVESLEHVADGFQEQVSQINELLTQWNACLMPTAMHPWMNPLTETRVWPHDNGEIYDAFNRIFGCKGHGWSNLQSMHLNFPFANDEEFGRLHAAIRLVLPILPALAASSPIMDRRVTGLLDNRLDVYRMNCAKIPSLTADIIPEPLFRISDYQSQILERLYRDVAPHDREGLLQHEWLNARGAIARFERNTIEVRLIDVQECPAADIAIAGLVWATVDALMAERWCAVASQQALAVEPLRQILMDTIRDGDLAVIRDSDYLACFGMNGEVNAGKLWRQIAGDVKSSRHFVDKKCVDSLIERGPVARRMIEHLSEDGEALPTLGRELMESLAAGELFE